MTTTNGLMRGIAKTRYGERFTDYHRWRNQNDYYMAQTDTLQRMEDYFHWQTIHRGVDVL